MKNVISSPNNEMAKRPRSHQNLLCLPTKYTNFSNNKPKNTVKDTFDEDSGSGAKNRMGAEKEGVVALSTLLV